MSSGKSIQPTQYSILKYNATKPTDFDVAIKYGRALMAIAGADGELAEAEFQWFIDEQQLLMVDADEYIEELYKFDWKNANIEELLSGIKYEFPVNVRRVMLYQAIKMSHADGIYHEKEKVAVAKAAEILGIEHNIVASLESLAEIEAGADRLRLALFETDI